MNPTEYTKDIQLILDSIRNVVRALRTNSRTIEKELGISSAQLFVLQQLKKKDGVSVNELALATHTHQSSVSVVVQKLAKRKWVIKKPSILDSRQIEIYLTPLGKEALIKAPPSVQEQLVDTLKNMESPKLHSLAIYLSELVKRSGFDLSPAPLFFEELPSAGRKKKGASS
jgi:DNA-binding MarR family transcriptional regulator